MTCIDYQAVTEAGHAEQPAPFFSVIIPTRNRPALFTRALQSVLNQSCGDFEVLIINDGSDEENLAQYRELQARTDARCRWHYQPARPNGHGPSYSINTGAHLARGAYLCILDDDDSWEAADHLQHAQNAITDAKGTVDAYYANQQAYTSDGEKVEKALWLNALTSRVETADVAQPVDKTLLLSSGGFPHLNCSIIRRELYLAIGGMDEGIRYECEVDFYLRVLDKSNLLFYRPTMIARHNVPRAAAGANVSTSITQLGKYLSQLGIYQKNLSTAQSALIRERCHGKLIYVYKHLASLFASERDYARAALYARLALALRFSIKWQAYCLFLRLRAAVEA